MVKKRRTRKNSSSSSQWLLQKNIKYSKSWFIISAWQLCCFMTSFFSLFFFLSSPSSSPSIFFLSPKKKKTPYLFDFVVSQKSLKSICIYQREADMYRKNSVAQSNVGLAFWDWQKLHSKSVFLYIFGRSFFLPPPSLTGPVACPKCKKSALREEGGRKNGEYWFIFIKIAVGFL